MTTLNNSETETRQNTLANMRLDVTQQEKDHNQDQNQISKKAKKSVTLVAPSNAAVKQAKNQLDNQDPNQQSSALLHFSYTCPGLHGPGSNTIVKRRSLADLLSDSRPLVIPLIQRAYCWSTATTIPGWWKSTVIGAAHSVGKAIYMEKDNQFWCLDGQQRVTTTALLVAAARDALLALRSSLNIDDNQTRNRVLASIERAVSAFNALLFLDVAAAAAWVKQQQATIANNDGAPVIAVGERLEFSRLIPSHVDRQPFFELITAQLINDNSQTTHNAFALSAATLQSKQYDSKSFFDARFAELMAQAQEPNEDNNFCAGSIEDAVNAVIARAHSATEMQHMIIDVQSENARVAQIYQWLQEKSLLSPGALLFNPNPGLEFKAADMVRNQVLAAHMNLSLEEQEQYFVAQWVERIEKPCNARPELIDRALQQIVDQFRCPPGDAEKQMSAIINSPVLIRAGADFSGLLLYVRILSIFAALCKSAEAALGDEFNPDDVDQKDQIQKQAAHQLVDKIAEYL